MVTVVDAENVQLFEDRGRGKDRFEWHRRHVPFHFAIRFLYDNVAQLEIRKNLFAHVVFAVVYLLFAVFTIVSSDNFYVSRAIRASVVQQEVPPTPYDFDSPFDVNSGPQWAVSFETLETFDDLRMWVEGVLIPAFYDVKNMTHPSMRRRIKGTEAMPQSPLRLRVLRMVEEEAHAAVRNAILGDTFRQSESVPTRYPPFSPTRVDRATVFQTNLSGGKLLTIPPLSSSCEHGGMRSVGRIVDSYPCGGHIVDFSPQASFSSALDLWRGVVDAGLIHTGSTRLVEFMFYVYAPGTDRYLSTLLQVEITAGGSIFAQCHTATINAITKPFETLEFFALAVIVLFFLHNCWTWFRQFVIMKKCFGIVECALDLYTYFELGLMGTLAASIICYVKLRIDSSFFSERSGGSSVLMINQTTSESAEEMLNGTFVEEFVSSSRINLDVNGFDVQFWHLRDSSELARHLVGFTTLLIFIRFLTLFRAFPSLSWITKVFETVAVRIVGVMCVLFFVVASFAAGGTLAFGHSLFVYRDFLFSFETVMLLILGDQLEYEGLRRTHPTASIIFFWAILILGNFLLLNFVMALLGESFDIFTTNKEKMDQQRAIRKSTRHLFQSVKSYRYFRDRKALWTGVIRFVRRKLSPPAARTLLEEIVAFRKRLNREHLARLRVQDEEEEELMRTIVKLRQEEKVAELRIRRGAELKKREILLRRTNERVSHSNLSAGEDEMNFEAEHDDTELVSIRQKISRLEEEYSLLRHQGSVPMPRSFVYDDIRQSEIVLKHKKEKEYLQCFVDLFEEFVISRMGNSVDQRTTIANMNVLAEEAFAEMHDVSVEAEDVNDTFPDDNGEIYVGEKYSNRNFNYSRRERRLTRGTPTPMMEEKIRACRDRLYNVQKELHHLQEKERASRTNKK